MFKYIGDIVKGTGTQLRSMVMVFGHGFRKRDTLQYPKNRSTCRRATVVVSF